MMNRLTETVSLSDGRKVLMQELSAMELMAASKLATSKGDSDAMAMAASATCFSIAEVDGQKFPRPTNIVSVQAFMGGLKARDFARLTAAYGRLNAGDDEGEAVAVDQA